MDFWSRGLNKPNFSLWYVNKWRSMWTNMADDLIIADSMAPVIILNER